jgi:hypothetical protein
MAVYVLIGLAIVASALLAMSLRIVKEYERLVQFRLGKVLEVACYRVTDPVASIVAIDDVGGHPAARQHATGDGAPGRSRA